MLLATVPIRTPAIAFASGETVRIDRTNASVHNVTIPAVAGSREARGRGLEVTPRCCSVGDLPRSPTLNQ
jgi:hypothetical protein